MTGYVMRSVRLIAIAFLLFTPFAQAQQPESSPPPLEIYGSIPAVRSVALSDSGNKIALLQEDELGEYVLVKDYQTGEQSGFKIEGFKPISVSFIKDRYVLLRASATESLLGAGGKFEYGFSFLFDTREESIEQLLGSVKGIYPGSDAGRVIGVLEDSGELLVPALTFSGRNTSVNMDVVGTSSVGSNVFRVDPENGKVRVFEGDSQSARLGSGGTSRYEHTIDWVVSSKGDIIAREDYEPYKNSYRIFSRIDGKWHQLFENDPDDKRFIGGRKYSVVGMTQEEDAIIMLGRNDDLDESVLYEMDLEGQLSGPLFEREGRDISRVLTDINRHVYGVEYSGITTDYAFFDAALETAFSNLRKKMEGFTLQIVDANKDRSRLLLKVSSSGETGSYYLFQVAAGTLTRIAKAYDIAPEWLGQMQTIEYKAADGLAIPAIVTWPAGDASENLPLIVLPHGGPGSSDSMTFHWMAQYFASRGYLVFQPNFRGSSGFGNKFQVAGYGEWGKAMQTDIHDGVKALMSLGWVDPERICIVGSSYGGYAALAGGMTAPELFNCIVAISPVTDLPDLLKEVERTSGPNSYAYEYWSASIGELGTDSDALKSTSPARNAEAFQAPVLLIHGKDDTVVQPEQSRKMRAALENAGKSVQLLEFNSTDHWLSTTDMRLQTLKAVSAFVETHIGAANQP